MNRRRIATVLSVFAAGALVGATISVPSHSAGSKVTNLLTVALSTEFTPDREVLIDLVEIPPNQKLDWHWHPGEEFHYYLEGEPFVSIGGKPAVMAEQGTVGHIPFRAEHVLSTREKGAKVVVFRVHTAGQPMRHLVGERKGG